MSFYKKADIIIKQSSKHGLVSSSIEKLLSALTLRFELLKEITTNNPDSIKIKCNLIMTKKIIDKFLNLIKLTNIYLYKCNKYEYVKECDSCSNMFIKLKNEVSSLVNHSKDDNHSYLLSIEKIISSGFNSLQSIIDNKKNKSDVSLILNYFDKTFEKDKSYIYDFIDKSY
jgi:hypothetical protein